MDSSANGKTPRFSILLPSRNRLELLLRAIDSVRRQDFTDFEIVVSDNCSEVEYGSAIAALDDPRIRLVRTQVAVPVTDNWNQSLKHARGQYVLMLGDDDALAPGCLARYDRLIAEHEAPDVIYGMAYHYAYAGVNPNAPQGYFVTLKPRAIYADQPGPTLLPVSQARQFGRRALGLRHEFGFNSQHFAWNRRFIESLGRYGSFFQSPYPDYYSSFVTMLKAERILVEPDPWVIIGISPRSFGFYFHQNEISAGNQMLRLSEDYAHTVRMLYPAAAAALDLPGSLHYRNWLIAALYVMRNLRGEFNLPLDLRRFRKLQLYETAYQLHFNRRGDRPSAARLNERLSYKERRFFDRMNWTFAVLKRSKAMAPATAHGAFFNLFNIYAPAVVESHEIGPHESISDAVAWLEARHRPCLAAVA
jgi:glycosyltransferase involved in cell wall biosynthesis